MVHLAAAQAALANEVWIITSSHVGQDGHVAPWLCSVPGWNKINVISYPQTGLAAQMPWQLHAYPLRRIVSACDIVHLHGVWDAILRVAATTARRVGTIYTVSPHGILDPWSLGQKQWKKRLALLLVSRRMLKGAAFLHVLNKDERTSIQALSLPCKTVVIPNGICPDTIAQLPPKGSFYGSHPELGSRPFILFLGRLHYVKGIDYLVNAFAILPMRHRNLDLVIAGPDSGEQHKIEGQVRELGLHGRVHFVGPLYGEKKLAALSDAAVLCAPSRQESFGMSIIEALACKVPVVMSSHCRLDEVAEIGAGEIVDLEPKAISSAISRLISNEQRRAQAGEAGHALIFARFTWPKIAAEMVNAYSHALGRG